MIKASKQNPLLWPEATKLTIFMLLYIHTSHIWLIMERTQAHFFHVALCPQKLHGLLGMGQSSLLSCCFMPTKATYGLLGMGQSSLLSCCFMPTKATYGLLGMGQSSLLSCCFMPTKATYGLLGMGQSSLLSCCFTATVATYGLLEKGHKLTYFMLLCPQKPLMPY